MSSPAPRNRSKPATARSVARAKQSPTNANIVDALDRIHGEVSEVRSDLSALTTRVETLATKSDMRILETDMGQLLNHFGLTSGGKP